MNSRHSDASLGIIELTQQHLVSVNKKMNLHIQNESLLLPLWKTWSTSALLIDTNIVLSLFLVLRTMVMTSYLHTPPTRLASKLVLFVCCEISNRGSSVDLTQQHVIQTRILSIICSRGAIWWGMRMASHPHTSYTRPTQTCSSLMLLCEGEREMMWVWGQ